MTVVIDPRHQRAVVFALDRLGPGLAGLAEQLRAGGVRVCGYSTRGNGAAARDDVVDCRVARPGLSDSAALNEVTRQLDIPVERCAVVDASRDGLAAARDAGFAVVIGVGDTLTLQDADMVVADTAEIVIRAFDGRMSTLPDALRCIELIGGVVAGHPCAVFFDFDGTLSEIVDDPASATLIDGAAEALASLAEVCPVAVLSGRSLPDVQSRVGVAGIWYAGSHGFEVCGPDGHVEHDPAALTAVPVLRRVADELRRELSGVPGVAVEDKRFAVAIHYRGVNPDRVGVVSAIVHRVGHAAGLRVTRGRKVLELRPDIDWDKGATLHSIVDHIVTSDRLVPVYLGDDLTDEDAFDAVRHDGIGVLVQHQEDGDRPTAAQFGLAHPQQTVEFVRALARRLDVTQTVGSDAWTLTFDRYQPEAERQREVLCATGNGRLATRGCAPESTASPTHYPGTYAAGVYNRLTDHIGGETVQNESMVNIPNWLPLTFHIEGGPWFDTDTADLLSYRQSMDLRCAELSRDLSFRDTAGRVTSVRQRRIVSMHRPHIAALQTTVVAENWSGTIQFRSTVDGRVVNAGVDRYRDLSGAHLRTTRIAELSPQSVLLVSETTQSGLSIAIALRSRVSGGLPPVWLTPDL